jgi:mono/diheme cytochrome c family protein
MPEFCRPFAWLAACSALLLSAASFVVAQDEDEESPYRPGLIATYAAEGAAATRVDEAIAFDWQDAAPDPRLPAGAFTAQWRGRLWTQTPGTYRLHCYVQGEVELALGGKSLVQGTAERPEWLVSEPIELPFERHALEIAFRKTGEKARLALYWSGPDFSLEPIPTRFLMHDREASPAVDFERGRQLAAALRCAACHEGESESILPAPALDKLAGNLHGAWLIEWLSQHGGQAEAAKKPLRRMPELAVTEGEATAIAAWLLRGEPDKVKSKPMEQKETEETKGKKAKKAGKKKDGEEEQPRPSAEAGERLIATRGCLACHQYGELGESGLFGGGDLTGLAAKRPGDFLVRWLSDPAAINRHHRMPRFSFTKDELASLDLWARKRGPLAPRADIEASKSADLVEQGERLVQAFRCAACHAVTSGDAKPPAASQRSLTAASDWSRACSGEPDRATRRPGYRLTAEDQAALQAYHSHARPRTERQSPQSRGRDLLVQLNCLACHEREGIDRASYHLPARLQEKLAAVAEAYDDLAPLIPSMTPPALNSVGDKLHDQALADAIRREGPPHRPYLLVEMPKFQLTDQQLADLTAYFTSTDRIPDRRPHAPREESVSRSETSTVAALAAAGPRLVTADGFGCTSCHQVGSVLPSKAPLNARGPDISLLDKRIRREWFDRWCANPARIVPRMEMPSVKVPVRGVLNDNVEDQLAAVWHTLNTPGFEPPEPNPVRVLRLSGVPERKESPIVIHDVVKDGDKTYLFPLVIGLPNRHNILFDLETNRLAA